MQSSRVVLQAGVVVLGVAAVPLAAGNGTEIVDWCKHWAKAAVAAVVHAAGQHPPDGDSGRPKPIHPTGERAIQPADPPARPVRTPRRVAPPRPWRTNAAPRPVARYTPRTAPVFWPGDETATRRGPFRRVSVRQPRQHALRQNNGTAQQGDASGKNSAPLLTVLTRRFEQLGAVLVRLEKTGPAGAHFEFRVEFPIPGNPAYNRFFSATDARPEQAMQRVLAEVLAWKSRPASPR